MRKNLFHILLALALCATPFYAVAADTSIAVVNIQRIMQESTAAKSVKDQLDAKQKSFQAEMSKREEELLKEDQELGKQRSVLSQEAFEKKAKDFRTKASAAQRDVQTKRQELDNALSSSLGQIQKKVFDIVSNIAKERGFTVVLPASQLLYADDKLDITGDVLSKLDKELPKITVSFKASPASGKSE